MGSATVNVQMPPTVFPVPYHQSMLKLGPLPPLIGRNVGVSGST